MFEVKENHLGVALIQPGGSRYEQMKWQEFDASHADECNKGGTAYITSLAIVILQGTFYIQKGRMDYENHIKGWLRKGVCRKQKCV